MSQEQKEALRAAVLATLYDRAGVALRARPIGQRIASSQVLDFIPGEVDVRAALEFLQGLGLVEPLTDPLGSSQSWKITSAGTLAHERRGA